MAARITDKMKAAIISRYAQGYSIRECGKQFGVSIQSVVNIIDALALKVRRQRGYGSEIYYDIAAQIRALPSIPAPPEREVFQIHDDWLGMEWRPILDELGLADQAKKMPPDFKHAAYALVRAVIKKYKLSRQLTSKERMENLRAAIYDKPVPHPAPKTAAPTPPAPVDEGRLSHAANCNIREGLSDICSCGPTPPEPIPVTDDGAACAHCDAGIPIKLGQRFIKPGQSFMYSVSCPRAPTTDDGAQLAEIEVRHARDSQKPAHHVTESNLMQYHRDRGWLIAALRRTVPGAK